MIRPRKTGPDALQTVLSYEAPQHRSAVKFQRNYFAVYLTGRSSTFGKVLSFSAAIHMFEFEPGDTRRHIVCYEDLVMGDFNTARLTDKNPAVCLTELENRVQAGEAAFPEIYMICGTEDSLIDANRSFKEKLERAGVPLRYEEEPGQHDFQFWSQCLPKMLDWMLK